MATIAELVRGGGLTPWDVKLEGRQQPCRRIFVTAQFKLWAQGDLPKIQATHWGGLVRASDQITVLMRAYRAGESLEYERQFKILTPWGDGVWEFKTGDVRIFGWFVEHDTFVASIGGDANYLKQNLKPRYGERIDKVVTERDALNLDEPKFINSKDVRDVIST
ncbi:hypothetical protein [Methylobacterium sp. Gmos1]